MKRVLSLLLSILLLFVSTCTYNAVSVYAEDNSEDTVIEVVEDEETSDENEVDVIQNDSTILEDDESDVDDTSTDDDLEEPVEEIDKVILESEERDNYNYDYSKPLMFENGNGDMVLKYDNPEIMSRLAAGDKDFSDDNYAELLFSLDGSMWYPIRYNPDNLAKYTLSDDLKTLIIPNYYLLTNNIKNGTYEVIISVSGYDDIALEEAVIISSGTKSAPDLEDISITSGDSITLTCNDLDWLKGIVKPVKIAFNGEYFDSVEQGGWIQFRSVLDDSMYHFDNTYDTDNDWDTTEILLSGNSITILSERILGRSMLDGLYEVTISSFGYEGIYDFKAEITTGVEEIEAEVSYDDGDILITSENTNWISKLCEPDVYEKNGTYKNSGNYINLTNSDNGQSYFFYNLFDEQESFRSITMYYTQDANTVRIPVDSFLEQRVVSGHYVIDLCAKGYQYKGKEVDYVSTAKSVPEELDIYFEEGKGVVIESREYSYLNKLIETSVNKQGSYVGLKNSQGLDQWQLFSNTEYDGMTYQQLIKDGEEVIIGLDVIKSTGLVEGDYEIKLSAIGYDEYTHPSLIHIKTADSVPTDLTVVQSKGDLIIDSADKEFLSNAQSVRVVAKNGGVYGFETQYNASNKKLVVKSHLLKEMGVIDGYYDIVVCSTGNASIKNVYIENTPYKFSITFNANGGKGSMSKMNNLYSGMVVEIPENKFTRSGYKFAGWSNNKNGPVMYNGLGWMTASKNNEAKTLYAIWDPILVEEINITSTQIYGGNIYVVGGKTVKLTADINPQVVANSAVTWSLVNPEDSRYATISSSGVVTAKKVDTIHTVGIVATAKDGSKVSKTKEIRVFPATEKVIIENSDDSTDVTGQTINVDPEEKNDFYLYATSEKPTLPEYTWKSSNTKLATVDEDGEVRIIGSKGTVKITATAKDGTNKSSSVTFNIAKKAQFIIKSGPSKVVAGKSIKLSVDVYPEDAANKAIIWSLVNPEDSQFATLNSSGTFTAKKFTNQEIADGVVKRVQVRAVSKDNPEGVEPEYFFVEIIPGIEKMELLSFPDWDTNYAGQTIVVDPQDKDTYYFTVKFDPETAYQDLDWTSSNTKLATVNSAGDVHIIGNKGTVKITAKATDGSNKSVSVNLKIVKKVQSINIVADKPALADDEVAKGKTLKLKAEVEPTDAADKGVIWSLVNQDNSKYVTISSSGVVTAKKADPNVPDKVIEVEVQAEAKDGSGVVDRKTIRVLPLSTEISMYMSGGGFIDSYVSNADIDVGMLNGEEKELYVTTPGDASDKATWTTSNKSIATVQDGMVTFTGKKGKVKITATAADGSGKSTSVYFNNVDIGTVSITFCIQNKSGKWVDGSKTLPISIMSRLTNELKKQNIHAGETGQKPAGIVVDTKIAGYVCVEIYENVKEHDITYEYRWKKLD